MTFFRDGKISTNKLLTPFGKIILAHLDKAHLRQQQLAIAVEMDEANLSNLLHGRRGAITTNLLLKINAALNLNEQEANELVDKAYLSNKKLTLPAAMPSDQVMLFNMLLRNSHHLKPGLTEILLSLVNEISE